MKHWGGRETHPSHELPPSYGEGKFFLGIDLSVTQWVGEVWHQRDVTLFFLDLERDGMDGGGHENHDFSMTYFLDAPII